MVHNDKHDIHMKTHRLLINKYISVYINYIYSIYNNICNVFIT